MKYSVEIPKLNKVLADWDKLISKYDISKFSPAEMKEYNKLVKKMDKLRIQRDRMQETLDAMKSFGATDVEI